MANNVIKRGPFKGAKVVMAPCEGIDQLRPVVDQFMSVCYQLEPGAYLVTDESSLRDLDSKTPRYYVKQLCWSQFGVDIGEEEGLLAIVRLIANQGRPARLN